MWNFFENNPDKILGKVKERSGRYGQIERYVEGSISEIERIDVSASILPSVSSEMVDIISMPETIETQNENLIKSLNKSEALKKQANNNQKKSKIVKTANKYIIGPDIGQEIVTGEEAFKILNPDGYSKEYLQAWWWYHHTTGKPINAYFEKWKITPDQNWFDEMLNQNILAYDPEEKTYVPSVLYYSGQIYEKIKLLENIDLSNVISKNIVDKQLNNLRQILPTQLKLTGELDQRLILDPRNKFCRETLINYEGDERSISSAFESFFRSLSSDEKIHDLRTWEVINIYLGDGRFANGTDAIQKAEFLRKAAEEVNHQMSKFLADEIDSDTRRLIENKWNSENNSIVDVNYMKIPLYFEFGRFFKESVLEIRPAQREGIAFQQINGTGIIAYDVGVGKTLTAILAAANMIQSGACKRPLISVPKPTYDKWIGEIKGIYDEKGNLLASGLTPQFTIYSLFNVSTKIEQVVATEEGGLKNCPESCIIMTTYDGMSTIGFSEDEESGYIDEFREILNSGFADETERQKMVQDQALNNIIGVGLSRTKLNIDKINIDGLIIDEAHNFNKIFGKVKGEYSKGTRESSGYQIQGRQSTRGVKAFMISNYIQRNNPSGNICLLTATPFTNSPLEVYSMLALTNIKKLQKYGIKSMVRFFDNYIMQTQEKVVTSKGIEYKPVIKAFKNKAPFQKLLFSFMNYKSGEEANIKRPKKWTLPLLSENVNGVVMPLPFDKQVPTFLLPTNRQRSNQREISAWLLEALRDPEESKKAPYLIADIKSKKNTLSPYIYEEISPSELTPEEFIESSPKLQFIMDCVESVKKAHEAKKEPVSGQIIYIAQGVNYFPLIKDYLIEKLGYKRKIYEYGKNKWYDEVEILAGSGDEVPKEYQRTDDDKEEIKDLFNAGKIKVIIGSSTIREGIDLQKRTSCLYAAWIDWNPTDYKQLEGRAWRFGNVFANVRIVTPLLVGSSDAFTYQKLEEKTARINDLFDRADKANILDVSEEDRQAVKWALIDDVVAIAKDQINEKDQEIKSHIKARKDKLEFIENINAMLNNQRTDTDKIEGFVQDYWYLIASSYPDVKETNERAKLLVKNRVVAKDLLSDEGKNVYLFSNVSLDISQRIKSLKTVTEKLDKLDIQFNESYNVSIFDDLTDVKLIIKSEIQEYENQRAVIHSNEYLEDLAFKLEEEKKKFNNGILSYEDTLKKFTDLNYLLFDFQSEDQKAISSVIEVKESVSELENINEAIEALKLLLEMAPDKEIKEAVEALELLITLQ